MGIDSDLVIRVLAFVIGFWKAGHYFVGANQLKKAPHWVKTVLFPSLVAGHIGMCFAAVMYGSGVVMLVGAALWVLLSIKDFFIWRAGAYMSDVLDRQQSMKEQLRQAYNLHKDGILTPWENVKDLVTPSGFNEMAEAEQRKERERA